MDWLLSEDSFFKHCAEIRHYSWGDLVDWKENFENPKLHHIRILEPNIGFPEFNAICDEFRPFFEKRGLTFSIKIPNSVKLNGEIMAKLKQVGVPLTYLKILPDSIKKSTASNSEFEVLEVTTEEQFFDWWFLYSTFPTKAEKLLSPFLPYALNAFKKGTQFYVIRHKAQIVSGLAFDYFKTISGEIGANVWGVATMHTFQNKGCYKILESSILKELSSPLYLQVIKGSALFNYYINKLGIAEPLEEQTRYELL